MKSVLMEQTNFLQPVVQEALQSTLEVEVAECLQVCEHERGNQRLGYRSGHYRRRLIVRVGTFVLHVPQDRAGHFSASVFEQYQQSEKTFAPPLIFGLALLLIMVAIAPQFLIPPFDTAWPKKGRLGGQWRQDGLTSDTCERPVRTAIMPEVGNRFSQRSTLRTDSL